MELTTGEWQYNFKTDSLTLDNLVINLFDFPSRVITREKFLSHVKILTGETITLKITSALSKKSNFFDTYLINYGNKTYEFTSFGFPVLDDNEVVTDLFGQYELMSSTTAVAAVVPEEVPTHCRLEPCKVEADEAV
jgi:hypothetical protein